MRKELDKRLKNFLIVGNMGSGKDTFADYLPCTYAHLAFATKLKEICGMIRSGNIIQANIELSILFEDNVPHHLFSDLQIFAMFPKEAGKDRYLLQKFGTDYCREWDDNVWVNGLKSQIEPNKNYVVTDCRFRNEFNAFPDWCTVFIEANESVRKKRIIERDGHLNVDSFLHSSETGIPCMKQFCDFTLTNNGSQLEFMNDSLDLINYVNQTGGTQCQQ